MAKKNSKPEQTPTTTDTPAAPARRRAAAPRRKDASAPATAADMTTATPAPANRSSDVTAPPGASAGESSGDNGNNRSHQPTYEEIAEAAYYRHLNRGGSGGDEFDDWVEAERELRERRSR